MQRVAVFGNTGAGKSTLARRLAELTGLPLFPLDLIQWRSGDVEVPHAEYLERHAEILHRPAWIIDGYGCRASAWQRFAVADTLVYIDLPLITHAWWVTKRLFQGLFATPEGWPAGSRMLRSTLGCYRTMWLCHRRLTPDYRRLVAGARAEKRVHHLRSRADISAFLATVAREVP
ncbi:MAG TPA: adenylate kinase [Polyangia bacterium]|nr:adenylate kinase [Polyangia bacterium]